MAADQQTPPVPPPQRPGTSAPDLGPGLAPTTVVAGRYRVAIQRTLQGTHALNHLVQDSTAAFALELGVDGTATACRGWRYSFTSDGPQVHTAERFREQQGYRGRYALAGGVAEVELNADDTVCPPRRESDLALARSSSIKLRCVLAAPHGHPVLTTPALLCEWVGAQTDEPMAYAVEGLGPTGWMALGTGNGLRVKVTGQPPGSRAGEPTKVTAVLAATPLGDDAWESSF
jgi:hypothetical protein